MILLVAHRNKGGNINSYKKAEGNDYDALAATAIDFLEPYEPFCAWRIMEDADFHDIDEVVRVSKELRNEVYMLLQGDDQAPAVPEIPYEED